MCFYGMELDKNKYKKPMVSSEGSALVAMTASAGGEAPPLTLPKGREFILDALKAYRQNSFPLGDTGMPPSGNSYIHAHEHYTLHDKTHVSRSNTVGVAKGAHHPRWTTNIIEIG